MATVITNPNRMELLVWLTIRVGLKLELRGMKHSHNSMFIKAKEITGEKTRKKCYVKMNELIRERKLELTPDLDDTVIERLSNPIKITWAIIGSDVEAAAQLNNTVVTNENAIEVTIDANYLTTHGNDKDADELVGMLCEKHGVNKVIKFLAKNIWIA